MARLGKTVGKRVTRLKPRKKTEAMPSEADLAEGQSALSSFIAKKQQQRAAKGKRRARRGGKRYAKSGQSV